MIGSRWKDTQQCCHPAEDVRGPETNDLWLRAVVEARPDYGQGPQKQLFSSLFEAFST
jgi:hypothetical protein